jgi:hypothetical protein
MATGAYGDHQIDRACLPPVVHPDIVLALTAPTTASVSLKDRFPVTVEVADRVAAPVVASETEARNLGGIAARAHAS